MVDNQLIVRTLSSIGIFIICAFALYFGKMTFYLLVLSLTTVSAFEWNNITKGKRPVYLLAFFIIILPYSSLIYIYHLTHGTIILLWLVFSIWGTDISAYFVGKNLGGWKIFPLISPNKTWIGLCGGILCSIVVSVIMSLFFGIFLIPRAIIIGIVIAILAQLGDFTESAIKRLCNAKDSGNLIPGHGGVLDRMDGFIFTAPLVAYYIESVSKLFE